MLRSRCSLAAVAVILLLFALTLTPAPSLAQDNPDKLHIHDAYARVLGGVGAGGAIYFVMHNGTDHDITLTDLTTDVAQMVGLHASVEAADGMMQMVQIEQGLTLRADQSLEFVPGGNHVMLMGMTRALKDGDSFAVALSFEGAPPMTFKVTIDNDHTPAASDAHAAATLSTMP